MGIRFICDNCLTQLNVKSAQAGTECVCPNCQSNILIPRESTVGKVMAEQASAPMLDVDHQIDQVGLGGSIMLDSDKAMGGFSVPYAPAEVSNSPTKSTGKESDSFLLDKPQPPSTLGKIDPIAEAPKKVWYFRSRELGEKGPLKSKVMQEYLDKGDVTIGCIVWREDWEDWQPAERVFPTLVKLNEERQKNSSFQIPDELNPHSELQRRKRAKWALGIVAIAAGLVTIGGLVILLTSLLSR